MHNFKELKVWQNARLLVKEIYLSTNKFPTEEKFGLIFQMRRSSVSLPSNIAEGSGRRTDKDFVYFSNVSLGSAYELQKLLFLSQDLEFPKTEALNSSLEEIQKKIYGLIKTIKI